MPTTVPTAAFSTVCSTPPTRSYGASLTAVIDTVTLPLAVSAPPVPCAPVLPSLNTQSICTEPGGASLALAYAICCIAAFTCAFVAFALNVSTSVPALFVVTVPMVVAPTVSAAPSVSAPSVPLAVNTSCALAPPLRDSVSVAPAYAPPLRSASYTVTSASSTTGLPFSVKDTVPPSVFVDVPLKDVSSEPSAFTRIRLKS